MLLQYLQCLVPFHIYAKKRNKNKTKTKTKPVCIVSFLAGLSHMSRDMGFPTMWYVQPTKPLISLRICADWPEPLLVGWTFYECWATDRTSFGVSKLKRTLHKLVKSTLVKMPHCWKSHFAAQLWLYPTKVCSL